jgi:hypothetical protein
MSTGVSIDVCETLYDGGWLIVEVDDDSTVHVVPCNDLVTHSIDDDCICIPNVEPCERNDGSIGFVASHSRHSTVVRSTRLIASQDEGLQHARLPNARRARQVRPMPTHLRSETTERHHTRIRRRMATHTSHLPSRAPILRVRELRNETHRATTPSGRRPSP